MTELELAKEQLAKCERAFRQHPTPSLGSALRRCASRVRYLSRVAKGSTAAQGAKVATATPAATVPAVLEPVDGRK